MAGYYGVGVARKDFGLHTNRTLPNDPGSPGVSMPGSAYEERERRTANLAMAESSPPGGKAKSSWTKRVRGIFKSNSMKRKASEREAVRPLEYTIDDLVSEASATSPTQLEAQSRRWTYGGRGRPGGQDQGAHTLPMPEPEDFRAPPQLIRIALLPKNTINETDTRQVTLRRKPSGFGIHLSGGLTPITVTYIEPGGEAELAGVQTGDRVVEVNGQDCRSGIEITRLMELKMLIQQVKVQKTRKTGSVETESSESEDEEAGPVDDVAWQRIKARQLQDDMDSVELTHIDDVSDTASKEDPQEFRKKAKQPSSLTQEVHISDKEWARMRQQKELLFDKNAPSAIIQEKGKDHHEGRVFHSKTTPEFSSRDKEPRTPEHGLKKSKSGSKKKSPSSGDLAAIESQGKRRKKGKKTKKRSFSAEAEIGAQESVDLGYGGGDGNDQWRTSQEGVPEWKQLAVSRKQARMDEEVSFAHKLKGVELQKTRTREELERERRSLGREKDTSDPGKVDIKVKRSGVIIGPRNSNRRPSLDVFDQSSSPEPNVSDGGGADNNASFEAYDMDLTAIPMTKPTLGLREGHARRDVVHRGSKKRRAASMKHSLLLDVNESEMMGRERVSLSEAPRRSTMPARLAQAIKPLPKSSHHEEEEKPHNLILHAHRNSFPHVHRQGSTPSQSTAEMVTHASSVKRQQSSNKGEGEEAPERHTIGHGGFSLLAEFSPREDKENVSRRLFSGAQKLAEEERSQEVEVKSEEPMKSEAETSDSKPRRTKTIDKPVKTLGIASSEAAEAKNEPAAATATVSVQLRKRSFEKKETSTENVPKWVAIAQGKHRRTSVLYGDQDPTMKAAAVRAEEAKEKAVAEDKSNVTHEPKPSMTSAPSSKPSITTPPATTKPSITTPPATTKPSITTPPATTKSSITTPPATTKPSITTPPATTKPSITMPPATTKSSITTPPATTKPSITTPSTITTDVVTSAPSSMSKPPSKLDSSLPKHGTVKDRLAMFQNINK